ncbi:MAG: archease [Deltaproteobacteria bacterium]|nr:archease [Deltaproteobacteria bacterium]
MSKAPLPGTCRPIEHTADLGLEFEAPTIEGLFQTAGLALFREMVSGDSGVEATSGFVEVSGLDREDLLIRFLNELLYLFEEERQVIEDISVRMESERHLRADIETVPFDPEVHEVVEDIKAATYHRIHIRKNRTWKATVIFDV